MDSMDYGGINKTAGAETAKSVEQGLVALIEYYRGGLPDKVVAHMLVQAKLPTLTEGMLVAEKETESITGTLARDLRGWISDTRWHLPDSEVRRLLRGYASNLAVQSGKDGVLEDEVGSAVGEKGDAGDAPLYRSAPIVEGFTTAVLHGYQR